MCSRCCQLLRYRLIRWSCIYSHQWINKDCLQTRNVKVDVQVIIYHYVSIEISNGAILQVVLIKWYGGLFHQRDLRKLLFVALLSNCSYVPAQRYPKESSTLRPLRHWRFHHNYGWLCNQKFHNGYKGFQVMMYSVKRGLSSSCVVLVVNCCATD